MEKKFDHETYVDMSNALDAIIKLIPDSQKDDFCDDVALSVGYNINTLTELGMFTDIVIKRTASMTKSKRNAILSLLQTPIEKMIEKNRIAAVLNMDI